MNMTILDVCLFSSLPIKLCQSLHLLEIKNYPVPAKQHYDTKISFKNSQCRLTKHRHVSYSEAIAKIVMLHEDLI